MLDRELGTAICRSARRWLHPSTRRADEYSPGVGLLHPRHGSSASIKQNSRNPTFVLRDQHASSGVLLASYLPCWRARSNTTGTGREDDEREIAMLVAWISKMLHASMESVVSLSCGFR
ncbi:unnamed protein product [Urochloa humidicola]